jgi:hypothetical protein
MIFKLHAARDRQTDNIDASHADNTVGEIYGKCAIPTVSARSKFARIAVRIGAGGSRIGLH